MRENQEYLNAIVHLYYRRAAIEHNLQEIYPKKSRREVKRQENELENITLMIMMVESIMSYKPTPRQV